MKVKHLLVGLSAVALVSCGGEKALTPEEVSKKFAEATKKLVEEGDISEFKEVASPEMVDLMAFMQEMGKDQPNKQEIELFTEVNCDVKENKASCDCKTASGDETKELYLEKIENKWLVAGTEGKKLTAADVEQTKAIFTALSNMGNNIENELDSSIDSLGGEMKDALEEGMNELEDALEEEMK